MIINTRSKSERTPRPVLSQRWQLFALIGLLVLAYLLIDLLAVDPQSLPGTRLFMHVALLGMTLFSVYHLATTGLRQLETPEQRMARRLETIQPLMDITLDIISLRDEAGVLQRIASQAAALLDGKVGLVFLPDREQNLMRIAAQSEYEKDFMSMSFTPGRGVTGLVWQNKGPVVVNGYQQWDNRGPVMIEPLDAVVGVPLLWQDEVIGTLAVADERTRTFSEADAMLLQPYADLASIAINNARLYGYVTQLTRELEQYNQAKSFQLSQTQEELRLKAAQLQGLFKRMTKLQELERARISRDMHDSTTQLILGAVYTTQAAMQALERDPETAREKMRAVQVLLQEIEKEIREAIRNLRPIMLDQEGVVVAVRQYLERAADLARLQCQFAITGNPVRLEEDVEVAVFRIVQEALQNITSHARAKTASVTMAFLTDQVQVTIEDDGQGFEYLEADQQQSRHYGLVGIRERAEGIGAHFTVESWPGKGTRLRLDIPLTLAALVERGQK